MSLKEAFKRQQERSKQKRLKAQEEFKASKKEFKKVKEVKCPNCDSTEAEQQGVFLYFPLIIGFLIIAIGWFIFGFYAFLVGIIIMLISRFNLKKSKATCHECNYEWYPLKNN